MVDVVADVLLPGALALLASRFVVESNEELAVEDLVDVVALVRFPLQAHRNEIFEVIRPRASDFGDIIVDDCFKKPIAIFTSVRRIARGQLISKAAKGPDIDTLGILDVLVDLGRYPIRRTFPRSAQLFLLSKTVSEA